MASSVVIGQRFGRLVVIERSEQKNRQRLYLCLCDCGARAAVRAGDLRARKVRSCGCLRKEVTGDRARTHGLSQNANGEKLRLYRIWKQMRQRCLNVNDSAYERYGGRGIRISPAWGDYLPFHHWALASGYDDSLTLDRINNDGDYEPLNCRWIPRADQASNKRTNCVISFRGEAKTLAQWAAKLGINGRHMRWRIGRWGIQKALASPVRHKRTGA